MKILQVTPFFSPLHGGSAEAPFQLSRELVRRGHEVTIFTSDYKLGREYIDALPGVKIVIFKSRLNAVKFFITPGLAKSLKANITGFDVVHLHNFFTYQNIVAHRYAVKHLVPYILQAHGSSATYFQRGLLKNIFQSLWGNRIVKDATRLLAVAPLEAAQYRSLGTDQNKIEIIPHGIDLAEFSDLPPKGEFRKKYGLTERQKVVLYLGRIDRVKGLDLLAHAFAALCKESPDARLAIVGPDDGYLAELKRLITKLDLEKKTLFTGPLYGKDKLKAYVDADVYILPSSYEIFGITALEALACGTPLVMTDRCGLAETVAGKAGLVVPYDTGQLREAILNLLNDANLRRSLAENGRALLRDQLNWTKIAERIERVYQEVIGQR